MGLMAEHRFEFAGMLGDYVGGIVVLSGNSALTIYQEYGISDAYYG